MYRLCMQDLEYLLGPDWRDKIPKSAAAQAYANHLQQLADEDPVLLLPYAFSLYVPILLGFMAQRIQKNLQLPDDRGLAFFTVSTFRRPIFAAHRCRCSPQLLAADSCSRFLQLEVLL